MIIRINKKVQHSLMGLGSVFTGALMKKITKNGQRYKSLFKDSAYEPLATIVITLARRSNE